MLLKTKMFRYVIRHNATMMDKRWIIGLGLDEKDRECGWLSSCCFGQR